jgi:hypothetical protein
VGDIEHFANILVVFWMVVTTRHSIQRFAKIRISGILYSGGNSQEQWHAKAIREEEIYSTLEW